MTRMHELREMRRALRAAGVTPEAMGRSRYMRELRGALHVLDAPTRTTPAGSTVTERGNAMPPLERMRATNPHEIATLERTVAAMPEPVFEPECEHCGDAKWVRPADPEHVGRARWDGREVAYERCSRCNAPTAEELLYTSTLPEALHSRTFAAFRPDRDKLEALRAARAWADQVQAGGSGSLLLVGSNGRGKTHLAAAAVLELTGSLIPVRFVYVPDFLDDMKQRFGEGGEDATAFFDRVASVRVLVLDDIGAVKPTGWVEERLGSLIDRRMREALPTLVTTDLSDDELAEALGPRIASRFRTYATALVGGRDMRGVV